MGAGQLQAHVPGGQSGIEQALSSIWKKQSRFQILEEEENLQDLSRMER